MSTFFVTKQPMTLDEAVRRLKNQGCTIQAAEYDDDWVIAVDPNGNYFHLGESWHRAMSSDASGDRGGDCSSPPDAATIRVVGGCYGLNNVQLMVTALDMFSEFDEQYDKIMGHYDDEEDEEHEEDDESIAVADWGDDPDTILESIDAQLAPFGLKIVQYDTGCGYYMWRIGKRNAKDIASARELRIRERVRLQEPACMDCGEQDQLEYYMLWDSLWDPITTAAERHGQLCLACVEARLGRPLGLRDFRFTPLEMKVRLSLPPDGYRLWDVVLGSRRTRHRLFAKLAAGATSVDEIVQRIMDSADVKRLPELPTGMGEVTL